MQDEEYDFSIFFNAKALEQKLKSLERQIAIYARCFSQEQKERIRFYLKDEE